MSSARWNEHIVRTADLANADGGGAGRDGVPARVVVEYPLTVLHQVWVDELRGVPAGAPRDGIELPRWLFERACFARGEKVTLTREHGEERRVEARANRTTTAVFPWSGDHVRASGPAALFLGRPGLSCLIAYGHGESAGYPIRGLRELVMADFSFPRENRRNRPEDLEVRCDHQAARLPDVPAAAHAALTSRERNVLLAQISGLRVEEAEDHCNPLLALIPQPLMDRAGLGDGMVGAFFCSQSHGFPSLYSYAVGSRDNRVASSGALAGAFPKGERFVVNVFGTVRQPASWRPELVHLET
jgi:hypothetical protein